MAKNTKIEKARENALARLEKRKIREEKFRRKHQETLRKGADKRMKKIKKEIDNITAIRQQMPHRLRSIRTSHKPPFKEYVIIGKGEISGLKIQYPKTEVLHMSLAEGLLMAEGASRKDIMKNVTIIQVPLPATG